MIYRLNSKSQLRVENRRIPAQGKHRPRLNSAGGEEGINE